MTDVTGKSVPSKGGCCRKAGERLKGKGESKGGKAVLSARCEERKNSAGCRVLGAKGEKAVREGQGRGMRAE